MNELLSDIEIQIKENQNSSFVNTDSIKVLGEGLKLGALK